MHMGLNGLFSCKPVLPGMWGSCEGVCTCLGPCCSLYILRAAYAVVLYLWDALFFQFPNNSLFRLHSELSCRVFLQVIFRAARYGLLGLCTVLIKLVDGNCACIVLEARIWYCIRRLGTARLLVLFVHFYCMTHTLLILLIVSTT